MMSGPLAGVKVVDLSTVLSGPIATQMLADQGADVIKVETPFGGDVVRNFGPVRNGVGALFAVVNRNKRSVAVDLKDAAGQQVLRTLLENADVLVENFRPGVMGRLGFDADVVARLNPRIIHGSITGFGPDGPYAERRAYDQVVQAVSGVAAIQAGPLSAPPSLVKTVICDKVTSLTLCQALTAALFARERTGKGEHISVAMLDAALAFCWPEAMFNHTFLEDAVGVPEFSAADLLYETTDGYMVIGALSDAEYAGLWRAIGRPDLIEDPRFANMRSRAAHGEAIRAEVEQAVKRMPGARLESALALEDVPSARVNSRRDLLTDPQIAHNGAIVERIHPVAGRMRQPQPPAKFRGSGPQAYRPAPMLGEHTREILMEHGYMASEIDKLVAAGAIGCADSGR